MAERALDSTLKQSLLDNDPFRYFHLVIFEKPVSNEVVGDTQEFSYFTDATHDISIDLGKGTRNFIANKLLSVGSINETIEAKASNLTIKLSADTIGSITSDSLTFDSNYTFTGSQDFTNLGFREGDKINVDDGSTVISATISSFSNANKTITVLEDSFGSSTNGVYTISLTTEEIIAIQAGLNYINRSVFVYRGHFDTSGNIIGTPFLAFKGIISSGKFNEDIENQSTMTWTLTSHWGDFVRVQGRLTSDAAHRALGADGVPDTNALLNPEYATDKGFEHSEKAISVIAQYNSTETRYHLKSSGLFGLRKKLESYDVKVQNDLDLNFNLNAKYLPVVYGVRRVDSIPIFVDLDKNNPNKVYVAYAICEGEIAGLYDVYVDDKPSVCMDASDESTRGASVAPDSVDVVCWGRADRGDVVAGKYRQNADEFFLDPIITTGSVQYKSYLGEEYVLVTTNYVALQHPITGEELERFYHGSLPDAGGYVARWLGANASSATAMAQERIDNRAYKIDKFVEGTLYAAASVINPGQYSIWGRTTYSPFNNEESGTTFYASLNDAQAALNLILSPTSSTHGIVHRGYINIDTPITAQLTAHTGKSLQLANPTLLQKSNDQEFKLQTEYYDGVVSEYWDESHKLLDTAYVVASYTIAEGETVIPSLDFIVKGKLINCYNYDGSYAPHDLAINSAHNSFTLGKSVDIYSITDDGLGNLTQGAKIVTTTIVDKFFIHLGDNIFEPRFIFDDDLTNYPIYRMYAAGESTYLTHDSITFGDYNNANDYRVSNNPAIQTLDYLTNRRYGKGLQLYNSNGEEQDINLSTFITAAQQCDEGSDVTVALQGSTISVGDEISYPTTGDFQFRGTVKSVTARGAYSEVVLTDCKGKLGYKWSDFHGSSTEFPSGWMNWNLYSPVWNNGEVRLRTPGGPVTDFTSIGAVVTTLAVNTPAGTQFINCDSTLGTASGNPIVRSYNENSSDWSLSGYSLYDSDSVKYWKYLGWDANDQEPIPQRWVTRHQLNQLVRTDQPLFTNINNMLEQFNGMLSYSNGKYELSIKTKADASPTTIHYISEDDIIGSIQISDNANKKSYNSIAASIIDPQNRFEARSVTFFNSVYLREDKNIPKQGRIDLSEITNYYNARFNCKQELDLSRSKKTITFTMMPKGYLILPGSIIYISYDRFNWTDKQFRISSTNLQPNGNVKIVADEHDDTTYAIPNLEDDTAPINVVSSISTPSSPTNLVASTDKVGVVQLSWDNPTEYFSAGYSTEIYYSTTNDRSTATLLSTVTSSNFSHTVDISSGTQNIYYWVRSVLRSDTTVTNRVKTLFSDYYPLLATSGVLGTALTTLAENYSITAGEVWHDPLFDLTKNNTDQTFWEVDTKAQWQSTGGINNGPNIRMDSPTSSNTNMLSSNYYSWRDGNTVWVTGKVYASSDFVGTAKIAISIYNEAKVSTTATNSVITVVPGSWVDFTVSLVISDPSVFWIKPRLQATANASNTGYILWGSVHGYISEPNATVGADWDTNITQLPSNFAGSNMVPAIYSTFENGLPPLTSSGNQIAAIDSSTPGPIGPQTLKLTNNGSNAYTYFGDTGADYNIPFVSLKKWRLSFYAIGDTADTNNLQAFLKIPLSGGGVKHVGSTLTVSTTDWARYSVVLDFSTYDSGLSGAELRFDNDGTLGSNIWLDGIMLEPYISGTTEPTPYVSPLPGAGGLAIVKASSSGTTSDIVLDPGQTISSDSFVTGVSGWQIDSDGNAEFQNATIRGTLNADDLVAGTITGRTLQTADEPGPGITVKRFVVDNTTNEAHFYGDQGDGTIVQLASIGISNIGSDYYIGNFGNISAGNSRTAVYAATYSGIGVKAKSETSSAVLGTSSSGIAIYGQSTSSNGVYGFSSSSPGVLGYGSSGLRALTDGSGGQVILSTAVGVTAAAPTHVAEQGTLYMTTTAALYKNTDGSTTWVLV